jgi:glycosyltransferase involved in cell wall biosynthesis
VRLLLVTHYYPTHSGGVEIAARRLAEQLVREDDARIEWMASDCDPAPADLPGAVRCIPARSWNGIEGAAGIAYPLWSAGAVGQLWAAVGRCDVVHLHESLYVGNLLAYLFARRRKKPVLVTQHVGAIPYGLVARGLLSLMNRTLARAVLGGADKVIFVSPAARRYFEQFCSFREIAEVVANGVDPELFGFADAARARELRRAAGRAPDRPLFLFVGRFVPRKGIGLLLSLAKRLPQADWIFAGNGPLRPEDGAPANVSILRGRSGKDIAALYQMADLLVLPSTGEGFPLVVQEAMACGTPALVSPETAAGSPAVLSHLLTEELEVRDAAERWHARIRALVLDIEALRRSRADIAAAARQHWSWRNAALVYGAALRKLAAT